MAEPHLCFVSAPGTSAFAHELLEAIAAAVSATGARASTHVGPFPEDFDPCVYVVIPHEFFLMTPEHQRPTPAQRSRTIALCVEHPGTTSFELSAFHAAALGAVMDISDDSTAELCRRGVRAERFRLGYSPRWDAWGGQTESARPVDITYLGTTDPRRDALLAQQAHLLSDWDCRLLIPPHEWMSRRRPDFLLGPEKLQHLASSRVLINLHRGDSRALEWVRAIEAMSNGCVVVSERSREFEPLVPGRHVLFARPENTAAVATAVLREPSRLERMRDEAYALCRSLDMRPSAVRLTELAGELLSRSADSRTAVPSDHAATAALPRVETPPTSAPPARLPQLATWATGVPRQLRVMQAMALSASSSHAGIERSDATVAGRPSRVHAIIPVADEDTGGVGRTVASLATQTTAVGWSVARWADATSERVTPVDTRRGPLLNSLVRGSPAEYLLIIEPGNELFRRSVSRLMDALDADRSALVAYGIMADSERATLWNALPFEPARLAQRAYLGSTFLVRTSLFDELGGFSEDPALVGYEYHEFWCRLAESGQTAVLVAQIIGVGRELDQTELSIASIAPELTWEALRRAAPRLLRSGGGLDHTGR